MRALGRYQDAAAKLALAAQTGQPPVELLCELARTQIMVGDITSAQQAVQLAMSRAPRHPLCQAIAQELNAARPRVITASAVGP